MLSQQRQRALQALLEAPDKRTAARMANIGERTLHNVGGRVWRQQ